VDETHQMEKEEGVSQRTVQSTAWKKHEHWIGKIKRNAQHNASKWSDKQGGTEISEKRGKQKHTDKEQVRRNREKDKSLSQGL
jgi:hypothetical protein